MAPADELCCRWCMVHTMALIGDGVMALVRPEHDAMAWKTGPAPWKKLMHELHEWPALTRMIGLAQIAGGVWWALQQEKADDSRPFVSALTLC